jgi:hypothetical protein
MKPTKKADIDVSKLFSEKALAVFIGGYAPLVLKVLETMLLDIFLYGDPTAYNYATSDCDYDSLSFENRYCIHELYVFVKGVVAVVDKYENLHCEGKEILFAYEDCQAIARLVENFIDTQDVLCIDNYLHGIDLMLGVSNGSKLARLGKAPDNSSGDNWFAATQIRELIKGCNAWLEFK